jgi:holin-like protein
MDARTAPLLPMNLRSDAAAILDRSVPLQVGVIVAFWLLGEAIVRVSGLPLPGAVVGLGLLFLLVATRRVNESSVRRGAHWFLAEMLLFFVPAVLAVLDYREFAGLTGLKVMFVIIASTVAVMLVTAVVVDRSFRWSADRARARRGYR